ncbi:hypothetical protein EES45_34285 [Streptomyces sp. ADI97-07]|nr:hypothetical protein EES45_34285 [Streptomyces sp. ADI97-07]
MGIPLGSNMTVNELPASALIFKVNPGSLMDCSSTRPSTC